MIQEVNKLIFNTLIEHHGVFLPQVGTLSLVHLAATTEHNRIHAPRLSVEFSSQQQAVSIVDVISQKAQIDNALADDIYSRWLDKSRKGSELEISGVGKLCNKSFVVDTALINQLNLYRDEPLAITKQKKKDSLLVVLLTTCFLAIAGFVCWYFITGSDIINNRVEPIEITDIVEPIVENIDQEAFVKTTLDDTSELIETHDNATSQEQIENIADWRQKTDIHHWVVVGSYSTIDNAQRAIADIENKQLGLFVTHIKLGSMFAVVIFGDHELESCEEFKHEHGDEFPQLWIHTPKRYK
jgi:hypothetical protein